MGGGGNTGSSRLEIRPAACSDAAFPAPVVDDDDDDVDDDEEEAAAVEEEGRDVGDAISPSDDEDVDDVGDMQTVTWATSLYDFCLKMSNYKQAEFTSFRIMQIQFLYANLISCIMLPDCKFAIHN